MRPNTIVLWTNVSLSTDTTPLCYLYPGGRILCWWKRRCWSNYWWEWSDPRPSCVKNQNHKATMIAKSFPLNHHLDHYFTIWCQMIQNFATVVIYESWCRKIEYVLDVFCCFWPNRSFEPTKQRWSTRSAQLGVEESFGGLSLLFNSSQRLFQVLVENISRFIIFLYFQPYPISNSNPSLLPSKPSLLILFFL